MKKLKEMNKQKKTIIYGVAILAIVGISFLTYNFIAKGATYGWLQASWLGVLRDQASCESAGGTWDATNSQCIATHTNNKTGWTAYFSKDSNVDTSNDQLTLASGSSSVVQTTTSDFDAGTQSLGSYLLDTSTVANQVTADFKYFTTEGTSCSDMFEGVYYVDSANAVWATAVNNCTALCSNCALPTLIELQCIYTNRANFGNNFNVTAHYWSATENTSTSAYFVYFTNGVAVSGSKSYSGSVRCVRRY